MIIRDWKVLGVCFFISGCAGATAIQPTAFLDQSGLLKSGNSFNSEYVANADWLKFRKVKVVPVSLDYYVSTDVPNKSDLKPLTEVIKKDFENALILAGYDVLFANETPDSRTLVIEPALTSVSATYNLAYVEGSTIGGPLSTGSASMELRVKDSQGRLLAMAAEKRKSGVGVKKGSDYKTRFRHAEDISKKWADELVSLIS